LFPGEKGTAYTLVTPKDRDFAGHLVRNLEAADQPVPQSLIDIALLVSYINKFGYALCLLLPEIFFWKHLGGL
jgi:ATP-dependent RNA helicase DDX42